MSENFDDEKYRESIRQSYFYPKAVAKYVRKGMYEGEIAFYGKHYTVPGTHATREAALAVAQIECDSLRDIMLAATTGFLKMFKEAEP